MRARLSGTCARCPEEREQADRNPGGEERSSAADYHICETKRVLVFATQETLAF